MEEAAGAPAGVTISVQNLSTAVSDEDVQRYVAALNVQMTRDFNNSPWVAEGLAQPVESVVFVPKGQAVPADTWHMEVLDTVDQPGALGYHEDAKFDAKSEGPRKRAKHSSRGLRSDNQLPLAKIGAQLCLEAKVPVSEVMSHEGLEAACDPQVGSENEILKDKRGGKIYLREVCDPVQETPYPIELSGEEEVPVSNFVMPAYFGLPQQVAPTEYDFCKKLTEPVPSMTPGGYLSFASEDDPENWQQIHGTSERRGLGRGEQPTF